MKMKSNRTDRNGPKARRAFARTGILVCILLNTGLIQADESVTARSQEAMLPGAWHFTIDIVNLDLRRDKSNRNHMDEVFCMTAEDLGAFEIEPTDRPAKGRSGMGCERHFDEPETGGVTAVMDCKAGKMAMRTEMNSPWSQRKLSTRIVTEMTRKKNRMQMTMAINAEHVGDCTPKMKKFPERLKPATPGKKTGR